LEEEENNKKRKFKLLLASSSPRRKLILQQLKINFDAIEPSEVVEKIFASPYKTVVFNSRLKAQFACNNAIINNLCLSDTIIAGFDTAIYMRGRYYGKPGSQAQAESYLQEFSGKKHSAITGVCLIDAGSGKQVCGFEVTVVKFRKLGTDAIKKYLESGNFSDKAGAYDIYGFGSILIEKINGCFYNVAGLPVNRFLCLMDKLGYSVL